MKTTKLKQWEIVLEGLMKRYKERVPNVKKVVQGMINKKMINDISDIENDHIAFRTLGVPHLGIESMEKIFLHYGYQRRDFYYFKKKKLKAYWYAPPQDTYPRIFLSELCVEALSEATQKIIVHYTKNITSDPVDDLDLNDGLAVDEFLHKPLWKTPSYKDFTDLSNESEYAGWVIYNRYYLNHFTISVHNLPKPYNRLETYNEFLSNEGLKLNTSNGVIKVSNDKKLKQSATVSELVNATFINKNGEGETHQIAGSYVEFAERLVLDEYASLEHTERKHRRDGFEVGNADSIFESTYRSQIEKN